MYTSLHQLSFHWSFRSIVRLALQSRGLVVGLLIMAAWLSAACSGSSARSEPEPEFNDPAGTEPIPDVLEKLQTQSGLIAPVPAIEYTLTMANTGIRISYTDAELVTAASPALIEAQWVFMQQCVQQLGIAPLVLVRSGAVAPFTEDDDVVRNEVLDATGISSVPIASASTLYGNVLQVSVSDFDGSLGSPLFNLRSIMGRYLWLSASLPERDYPFDCARRQP